MSQAISKMTLKAVRSPAQAVERLLRPLGYEESALPHADDTLGLPNAALRLWTGKPSSGYGILVTEMARRPRSLRALGRRLCASYHDRPLAVIGITADGPGSQWTEFIIMRPRLIQGGSGAVTVAKLQVDVRQPTRHDVEVINELRWDGDDEVTQRRIDQALDVERVTKRFFKELSDHHQRVEAAVSALTSRPELAPAVERAGGAQRVALRLVTQVLFCYFVQRKGLLEGRRDWLSEQFRAHRQRVADERAGGRFYQTVVESLFYEALAVPAAKRSGALVDRDLPFLNGGLFERLYGDVSLPLADDLFTVDGGLLGFLDDWTFTIAEEAADEAVVAVDPEMLGKVFENLISDEEIRREGTVYTPRPVVQFMCREALVPYLCDRVGLTEEQARLLLTDDEQLMQLAADGRERALTAARRLDDAMAQLRVVDPAVGSGAFLLGMMTEIMRLRSMAHQALAGCEPSDTDLWRWKRDAIERTLFGVDINPTAIDLCRLRLWLSLLVDEPSDEPHPLPNLEYRTVCADSLTDYVGGVEVQQTRSGALTLGLQLQDPTELVRLRERYFEAWDPAEKAGLRAELAHREDEFVARVFERAAAQARQQRASAAAKVRAHGEQADKDLAEMKAAFASRDRLFPLFLPAFHAPDVASQGGWDIVIMNPPYVGRKEVPKRLSATRCADLELHYGRTYDLMLHFALRALQLTRRDGVVSMVFNDSIFTSLDAVDVRRTLTDRDGQGIGLLAVARTRCFQGRAVNGGVIVAQKQSRQRDVVRWVENHGRPPADLAGASVVRAPHEEPLEIGGAAPPTELWVFDGGLYRRLPHRPLFRPSPPAVRLLGCFETSAFWSGLQRWSADDDPDFEMLSQTKRLERWKNRLAKQRLLDAELARSRFVLLGIVCEGGQGLATADDRRFLGVLDGTPEADEVRARQEAYEGSVLQRPLAAEQYRDLRNRGLDRQAALVQLWEDHEKLLVRQRNDHDDRGPWWPRIGLLQVVSPAHVRHGRLSEDEVKGGLDGEACWVPFEKGDDSEEGGAAKWRRDNPIVIDWSHKAVALLRRRAANAVSHRKPYFRNEHLWGQSGVTWNRVASYLRCRLVPDGGIFCSEAPTIFPEPAQLGPEALLALMNAPVLDFLVRTFLGSRMHVEIGDLRRIPLPVLSPARSAHLSSLGSRALAAKEAVDAGSQGESLAVVEAEIDRFVRDLYGIGHTEQLWVVR